MMILIVFGRSGVGKTYVGHVLSERFGFYHADADGWLTPDMIACLQEKRHFSFEMIDEFTDSIITQARELARHHPRLAITQALYRSSNRQHIATALSDRHLQFIHVETSREVTDRRLLARNDWVDLKYAHEMDPYFQAMPEAFLVNNTAEGPAHVEAQLAELLDRARTSP